MIILEVEFVIYDGRGSFWYNLELFKFGDDKSLEIPTTLKNYMFLKRKIINFEIFDYKVSLGTLYTVLT